MRVKELIQELSKLPEDLIVVVRGYEGGINELRDVESMEIALNVNTAWYYGKHEDASDAWRDYSSYEKADAVHLR